MTYLSQVRQLRNLATEALKDFPVRSPKVIFIQHGENATFKVEASNGNFLLRIHRGGYHSPQGIREELNWLDQLAQGSKLQAPRPVRSRKGNLVELISNKNFPMGRMVDCFHWLEGRFLYKSLNEKHMFELGSIIGQLQNSTKKLKTKRLYWNAEGLVGNEPKWGSIDKIYGLSKKQQQFVTRVRKTILRRLKNFERNFPNRMGLIHSDLHFGNVIQTQNGLAPIDFDDCGYGFYTYDLVAPLASAKYIFSKSPKKIQSLKSAIIDGYSRIQPWDSNDAKVLEELRIARELTIMAWLNSRSDNPRLKNHLRNVSKGIIQSLRKNPALSL